MSKATIIRILLHIYPGAWRSEYGEELSAILADRPFTTSTIGNVVFSGVRQRFRYAKVWQIGGTAMALWLIVGTVANSLSPLPRPAYNHFFEIDLFVELAIGYIYATRYHKHSLSAAFASSKAALIGIIPELLLAALWVTNLIHPMILGMNGSPHIHGHGIIELCLRTEGTASPATLLLVVPIMVVPAFLLGFVGATIAIGASATRRLLGTRK